MDQLGSLSEDGGCSLLLLGGSEASPITRYVASTAETRAVCNRPEIVGVEYTRRMQAGMTRVLRTLAAQGVVNAGDEERLCVLHFLRGGLNFGLREALHDALGVNRHGSAFLSSQRVEKDGRWTVREDAYRKLTLPDDAVLVCGDVVATGATLRHGLEILLQHLRTSGIGLRRLVFFTIGCERLEDILADLDPVLRSLCPQFEGSTAVYLEGRFVLAEEHTPLRIVEPGTDLLRTGALLAPAFARSQAECVSYPLERCAIYDAGSRAFDIPAYLADVRRYWQEVARLAAEGWTLGAALGERWMIASDHTWTAPGGRPLGSSDALAAVAAERLRDLSG